MTYTKIVNGVTIEMTPEEIEKRKAEEAIAIKEAAATEYIRNREREYPSTAEQLDMIFKDKRDSTNLWFELIDTIKKKYPKPTEQ